MKSNDEIALKSIYYNPFPLEPPRYVRTRVVKFDFKDSAVELDDHYFGNREEEDDDDDEEKEEEEEEEEDFVEEGLRGRGTTVWWDTTSLRLVNTSGQYRRW